MQDGAMIKVFLLGCHADQQYFFNHWWPKRRDSPKEQITIPNKIPSNLTSFLPILSFSQKIMHYQHITCQFETVGAKLRDQRQERVMISVKFWGGQAYQQYSFNQ